MNAKRLEKLVVKEGWVFIRQSGSHRIFKHSTIIGLVVIPFHGSKDIPKGTLSSILKKSGIKGKK